MASLSIWRSASKAANSPQLPSLHPRKVSRVCFTSASKFHENQYAREDSGREEDAKAAERMREARQVYENDQEAEEVERKYQGMRDKAKEGTQQASEAMEDLKETTKDKTNIASEKMYEAKDKVKARVEKAGDTMHDAKERTKETVQNVGEKAKETAKDATKKIKDTVVGDDGNKVRPEDYMEDRLPKRPGDARDQKADRGFP